ncbi:hypothetical protein CL633_01590 [bacterium]|nr:hypothetical protein [bacterium]|tara:strand:+ start:12123 stop:13202 length:1080 start_codon:yes stop_codon:yes gene_type:complete
MRQKILLIMNIITPYNIPVYNYLALKLENFEIYFLAKIESNRQWRICEKINFKYKILRGLNFYILKKDWGIHINPGLFFKLIKLNPDIVVIGGYDAPSYWLALLYCKIFRKKIVLWSGSTLLSSQYKYGLIGFGKKIFIKSADSYLSYGTKAKEYLEYFGAKPDFIINGYNTVDIKYFQKCVQLKRHANYIMLFVGHLAQHKGIKEALQALKLLKNSPIFIIIGDGPKKENLKNYCQKHKLDKVHFKGYIQKHEIINYYSKADFLIMPSLREVWGLVINEALASGLFILASKYAGATYDLIKSGENGFIIDPYNIQDIKDKIIKVMKLRLDKEKISQSINKFSPENYGENLIKAIKLVL